MEPIIIISVFGISALINGIIAENISGKHKGRPFAWGFVFGPIGLIVVALLSIRAEIQSMQQNIVPVKPTPNNPTDLQALADINKV